MPDDYVKTDDDYNILGEHSFSWLSLEELLSFNYDVLIEDKRATVKLYNNSWTGVGRSGGEVTTYREFLGSGFFKDLEELQKSGAERIVFGFDS